MSGFVEDELILPRLMAEKLLSDTSLLQSLQWESGTMLQVKDVPHHLDGSKTVLLRGLTREGVQQLKERLHTSLHLNLSDVSHAVLADNKKKKKMSTKKVGTPGRVVENVSLGEIRIYELEHLNKKHGFSSSNIQNLTSFSRSETHMPRSPRSSSSNLLSASIASSASGGGGGSGGGCEKSPTLTHTVHQQSRRTISYNVHVNDDELILYDIVRRKKGVGSTDAFVRAGPREFLHFNPKDVKAAIVTCGGLCPGLNNVIRELVHALYFLYGVDDVTGIVGGYNGFHKDKAAQGFKPVKLTLESVHDCHHIGGTILASSRGGLSEAKPNDPASMEQAKKELDEIVSYMKDNKINQLYVIGGDGTHRGANKIALECIKQGLNVSVVCIPKTIDNDVDLIDYSFGFQTSVEAAQNAILSAKTEARCNMPNGIGIVKLMGRSSGFIAAHATLASGDVDLCLVPEIEAPDEFKLLSPEEKKKFLSTRMETYCDFLKERLADQGHAVIVVAEGAMEKHLEASTSSDAVDAGGNKKIQSFESYLKEKIPKYFKDQSDPRFKEVTIKYIDPSYMIRSVPANAADSLYCMMLGQNAVHGAMAGFTAFSVGIVNTKMVYIPIPRLVETSPRKMDANGRTWERVLAITGQAQCFADDDNKDA